jgi:hypothetical protein
MGYPSTELFHESFLAMPPAEDVKKVERQLEWYPRVGPQEVLVFIVEGV